MNKPVSEMTDEEYDNYQLLTSFLIDSIAEGNLDEVKEFIEEKGVNPNDMEINGIVLAAKRNQKEVLEYLLKIKIIDPNYNNGEALLQASLEGYEDIVKLLLDDPRTNPNISNKYAFFKAADFGHFNIVKLFLENKKFQTPTLEEIEITIDSVAVEGYADLLELLLYHDRFADMRLDPLEALNNSHHINPNMDIVHVIFKWYHDNNIPIEDFIDGIEEYGLRKYILRYYDVENIPEDEFDFGVDIEKDYSYIDSMLALFAGNERKKQKFLRLIDYYSQSNVDPESYLSEALTESDIPDDLISLIGKIKLMS